MREGRGGRFRVLIVKIEHKGYRKTGERGKWRKEREKKKWWRRLEEEEKH